MGLLARLNRLDESVGVVRPDKLRLTQRELWNVVLKPPLLWWLVLAMAVTAAATAFVTALSVVVGPILVLTVVMEAARRVRKAREAPAVTLAARGASDPEL